MQAALFLTLLFGVLVAVIMADAPPSEEKKKLVNECKVQEKATDEDVNMFFSSKIPTGPNGKCFLACVFEKSGFIKDGKVNAEALKAGILKDNGGNEKAAGPVNEVVADCQSLTNDKKCELAFQLMDCVLKSYAKRAPAPK